MITLIAPLLFPVSMEAKNYEYQGYEIVCDQPSGELRYYDVNLEGILIYKGWNRIETTNSKVIVPFIFDNDKVYVQNLFGDCGGSMFGSWIEGRLKDGDIIFETGSAYSLSLSYATWKMYFPTDNVEPLYLLNFVKLNVQDLVFEEDVSITNFTLKGKDSGFIMEFAENEGMKYRETPVPRIITKLECQPSKIDYIIPPSGYITENYQVNFRPYSIFVNRGSSASLRLKVVKTENEIYIQGMSARNPEVWIKGEIKGNKVIFKNGIPFGVSRGGENMYFTPIKVESSHSGDEYRSAPQTRVDAIWGEDHFVPTKEDLTLDYDPITGKLSNQSADLAFTSSPDAEWTFRYGTETGLWDLGFRDFFREMELIKVPENITYEPLPMDGRFVDYRDKNGYMMDPDNLYVRFFADSKPVGGIYNDYNTWERKWGEVFPFGPTYLDNKYGLDGVGSTISHLQGIRVNLDQYNDIIGYLYYSEDGEVPETPPVAGITIIQDNLNNESGLKSGIYDLTGRKYESKENLLPGLYIINGKKVAIK